MGLRLRLGTCTSKLIAFLVERRGLHSVASLTAAPPSFILEVTVWGTGNGICRIKGWGGLHSLLLRGGTADLPWGHRQVSWAFGAHSFLSSTEELDHISDDVAKAVIHLKVGTHPGGQLGPGISIGKPGG